MSPSNNTDKLRLVTEETRGNLVQDILGHPRASPSFDELNYLNPSKSRSTIREHLETLIHEGIVKKILLDEADRGRDNPYTFYTLTNEGLDLLVTHNLFVDEVNFIREDYGAVEKPDFVKKCESAPRPDAVEERLADIDEIEQDPNIEGSEGTIE